MGADSGFAVLHKDHLPHLREVVQPMGDQEHRLVLCVGLQVRKHRILGAAIQRGERVVQDQDGSRMGKCSGQRQPLRLPAGQAGAAAADHGIKSVFHA